MDFICNEHIKVTYTDWFVQDGMKKPFGNGIHPVIREFIQHIYKNNLNIDNEDSKIKTLNNYLLNHYETNNNKLPVIDDTFINCCMKILCNEKASGRPPKKEIKELKDKLTAFYKTDFQPLIQNENLDYTHMNTILDYLTIDILTMYENNIKLHYVEYVERYVNVVWKKKFIMNKIRKLNITQKAKEQRVNNLCNQLRKIKIGHIAIIEGPEKFSFGKKKTIFFSYFEMLQLFIIFFIAYKYIFFKLKLTIKNRNIYFKIELFV